MEEETFNFLRRDIEVTDPTGRKVGPRAVVPGQTVMLKLGTAGDVEAVAIQASVFQATVVALDTERRMLTIET